MSPITNYQITKTDNIDFILTWAIKFLAEIVQQIPPNDAAVVFDIDDTILLHTPRGPTRNEAMFHLYLYILRLGINVYFITARPLTEDNKKFTFHQLNELGFTQFSALFLNPKEYQELGNYSLYKSKAREYITTSGKSILLTIGDNWADATLLPPFVNEEENLFIDVLKTLPPNLYYIVKPPMNSWMAIKLPD